MCKSINCIQHRCNCCSNDCFFDSFPPNRFKAVALIPKRAIETRHSHLQISLGTVATSLGVSFLPDGGGPTKDAPLYPIIANHFLLLLCRVGGRRRAVIDETVFTIDSNEPLV